MKSFLLKHHLICLLTAVIVIFGIATVFAIRFSRAYIIYTDYNPNKTVQSTEVQIEDTENPDRKIVSVIDTAVRPGSVRTILAANEAGSANVSVFTYLTDAEGNRETICIPLEMSVNDHGMIFAGKGISNYAGMPVYYLAVAIFALLVFIYYGWIFINTLRTTPYSYKAIAVGATSIFFVIILLGYATVFLLGIKFRHLFDVTLMSQLTENIMGAIIVGLTPFVIIFAILMAISNIALMRREGFRPVNSLGIIAGLLMLLGCAVISVLLYINLTQKITQPVIAVTYSVCASLLVVFEVLLISTMICGTHAAKHQPAWDKDYIIILGCGIKKDGTLYPLLQGRVDRAIAFYHQQFDQVGKHPVLVPSGGKGSDEIISEGEAMTRYLLEHAIPQNDILAETQSTTTYENMLFSDKLIKSRTPDAKIAFSTTNFHVFRSGLLAAKAGLNAEGMGSKTKWYFWPNAFLREIVGLFAAQPKKQFLLLAGLVLSSGAAGYLYSLIV